MKNRILIVVASIDGQAERIANRIAATLDHAGHAVTLRSADAPALGLALRDHDAVVIGGGIRYGRHARSLERLASAHRDELARMPNAFFSVCLSAGGPGAKPAQAQQYVAEFRRRTQWDPGMAASFAGALPYTRYNPLVRLMMRLIVRAAGGETDTSRDYEYTDWDAVERFASTFAGQLAAARAA